MARFRNMTYRIVLNRSKAMGLCYACFVRFLLATAGAVLLLFTLAYPLQGQGATVDAPAFRAMTALYPGLTVAEPRCLVLEKPGLSAREMANIPGVSDGSIRRKRLRLRRKTSFWSYCNVFVTPPSRGMC